MPTRQHDFSISPHGQSGTTITNDAIKDWATITPTGATATGFDGFKTEFEEEYRASYGADIDLRDESTIANEIRIASLALVESDESVVALANVQNMNTAAAIHLEDTLSPFGTVRETETETDISVRRNHVERLNQYAVGTNDSIKSALLKLSYIDKVLVRPNDQIADITVQTITIPNRTIYVAAFPAISTTNQAAFLLALLRAKPPGIPTSGAITATAMHPDGWDVSLQYSNVTAVPFNSILAITLLPAFPGNGLALVRQAVVDYFGTLVIGDQPNADRMAADIYQVGGLLIGTNTLARQAGNAALTLIQLATITDADIGITLS